MEMIQGWMVGSKGVGRKGKLERIQADRVEKGNEEKRVSVMDMGIPSMVKHPSSVALGLRNISPIYNYVGNNTQY